MATAFLLMGPPGVGKTTLLRRLIALLDVPAAGFFTAEIREGDRRVGFAIEDLAGRRGVLAREAGHGRETPTAGPRVGRYRVDVAALDAVGAAALERGRAEADLLVIDEIGKMEAFSPRFRAAVERALETPGAVIVGTILKAAHPWIDGVKARSSVRLVPITAASRDAALAPLAEQVRAALADAARARAGVPPQAAAAGNAP